MDALVTEVVPLDGDQGIFRDFSGWTIAGVWVWCLEIRGKDV